MALDFFITIFIIKKQDPIFLCISKPRHHEEQSAKPFL